MKFTIGDIVVIIHSKEKGEIIDIINDEMFLVKVGGVNFPVYKDQIEFSKTIQKEVEKKIIDFKAISIDEEGVWVSISPVFKMDEFGEEIVKKLKISLLNNTKLAYNFSCKLSFLGSQNFESQDKISATQLILLNEILLDEINDYPILQFEFSLIDIKIKKDSIHFVTLKLKPKQVFLKIEELKIQNKTSFSYLLFNEFPKKIEAYKPEMPTNLLNPNLFEASRTKENLRQPLSVVDLHIEKLSSHWQKMSNFEILSLQLKTLEIEFELSIAHLQPSLIVIHGVGTGKLKNEIHDWLKTRKEVKSFVNQYDSRFGYGATKIYFQYH